MKFKCLSCNEVFVYAAVKRVGTETNWVELHCCPYCLKPDLDEYQDKLESVVSVEIAAVDGMLRHGYEVKDLYAKTATLIKKQ